MTREDFRRELGGAFDDISGSPDPALAQRVRSALVESPERRGPVWIPALAAAVIAVLLVGVLLFGNPLNRHPLISGGPRPTPSSSPAPVPSPSPSPSPTASPGQVCADETITQGKTPQTAFIDALRTGTHPGYDRLTIEFKGSLPPNFHVIWQAGATFTLSPSNQPVTLAGTNGILLIIKGADAHTSYAGVRDIKTNYPGLAEVRVLEDFEGQVTLGLGLNVNPCHGTAPLTTATLENPTRVVIDIPTPAPTPTPTPTPSALPSTGAFICGASSTFTGTQAFIDGVRAGKHVGYDRLTIEFQNGLPGITLHPQTTATFSTVGGKGTGTVTLSGRDGLLVSMFSTDAHTAYSGPLDIKTGFGGLLEVRVLDDNEGHLDLGLGLSKPACYHAYILTNPSRLVIDIKTG